MSGPALASARRLTVIRRMLATSLVLVLSVAAATALCAWLMPAERDLLAHWPWWQMLAVLLVADNLTQYFWHRLSHTSIIWPLHRAHHSAAYMSVRVVYRDNAFYYALMPGLWLSGVLLFLGFGWVYVAYTIVKLTVIIGAHSATEEPRSLTTTLAPSLAINSANSRPMPPPAPVITATLPSIMPFMLILLLNQVPAHCRRCRGWQARSDREHPCLAPAPATGHLQQSLGACWSPSNRPACAECVVPTTSRLCQLNNPVQPCKHLGKWCISQAFERVRPRVAQTPVE